MKLTNVQIGEERQQNKNSAHRKYRWMIRKNSKIKLRYLILHFPVYRIKVTSQSLIDQICNFRMFDYLLWKSASEENFTCILVIITIIVKTNIKTIMRNKLCK